MSLAVCVKEEARDLNTREGERECVRVKDEPKSEREEGTSLSPARVKEEEEEERDLDSREGEVQCVFMKESKSEREEGTSSSPARVKQEEEEEEERDLDSKEGEVQCVFMKEEPKWEHSMSWASLKEEAGGQMECDVRVQSKRLKEEPELTQDRDSSEVCPRVKVEGDVECGVSAAASQAGLYSGHEARGELVLGPERLQPPDSAFTSAALADVRRPRRAPRPPRQPNGQSEKIPLRGSRENLKCETCMEQFEHKFDLVKHKRIHTGDKTYYCKIPIKRLSQGNADRDDHKKTHTREKLHTCEVCMKRFKWKSNLFTHKKLHTGDKPYTCEICARRFKWKSNWVKHRNIHTEDKPHTCEICMRQFKWKSNLVIHKRIHTKVKPYPCDVCMKRFTHKKSLVSHKVLHSEDKPYTCDICMKRFVHK